MITTCHRAIYYTSDPDYDGRIRCPTCGALLRVATGRIVTEVTCGYVMPNPSDYVTLTSGDNWKPSRPVPCTRLAIGIDADGHPVCPEHCLWNSVTLVPRWLAVLERATRARPGPTPDATQEYDRGDYLAYGIDHGYAFTHHLLTSLYKNGQS